MSSDFIVRGVGVVVEKFCAEVNTANSVLAA